MSGQMKNERRLRPALAAVLALVFGPFGYFYLGWRYALSALIAMTCFVVGVTLVGIDIPSWMRPISLSVYIWKAFELACAINAWNEDDTVDRSAPHSLNRFGGAWFATSDLLIRLGLALVVSFCIKSGVSSLIGGHLFQGLGILLLGTPVLVGICSWILGLVALGLDALAIGSSAASDGLKKTKPQIPSDWDRAA